MDNFGYIGISLLMLPLWIYIYVKAQWLRKRMRSIGVYLGILTIVVQPIFINDYWNPPSLLGIDSFYAIEDFMFGFILMGIAISIYNYIFKIRYTKKYVRRKKLSVILSLGIFFFFIFMTTILNYNSIFVLSYSLIVVALFIIYVRRDLFIPALFTAIFILLFLTIIYLLLFNLWLTSYWDSYWKLIGTPYEYYILGIPWTEYLFYFSVGFFISILYDFASGTAKDKNA